jgi:hypothetical protein
MAATEAIDFAKVGLINRDYDQAHARLALRSVNRISRSSFQKMLENMHTRGWPRVLRAVAYEPLPGQRALRIFLEGQSANEEFFYVFVMDGDADTGYHVADILRRIEPFKASRSMKSLPVERTTN